ncbi:MAG: flagellar protein FlaG [Anaerolineales bacterium]|nr:flagellar protein FlaG [Anaerolineales bacterium]
MTEPITPIDANAELRSQIVDVVRSALRPDARPLEATPAPGTTTAENTPPPGRKAEDDRAAAAERKAEAEAEASRNLALRFRIDPDTHDVTVLLVDQATKRIVRSVPPEDLQKLNNGDLVHLLA